MRWHCAVGEAGEGQVRRGKRSGRWGGSNGGARGDLNRNERRERRADSRTSRWGWRVCSKCAHLPLGGLGMMGT